MVFATHPVEIRAPDLAPFRRGNTNVDYVHSFESGRDGPHVMLSAVVHGNELCGAIVLAEFLRRKLVPRRGRLTLAFVNAAAFHRFDPVHPSLSRYVDEDFNRLWDERVLDGPRTSAELTRAREIRKILDTVDYLLDIHSMQYGRDPLTLSGTAEKGRRLAQSLGFPAHVVCDAGHNAGKRMRDYGGFDDESDPRTSLLVECGEHWKAATVSVAREVAERFLVHFEMLERDQVKVPWAEPLREQQVIEVTAPVTVKTMNFRFLTPYVGLEVIPKAGTVIGYDGPAAVVTPYDECVLIMPSRRLGRGGTAVRFGRYLSR